MQIKPKDRIRAIKILIEWLQSKDTRKWLKRLNKEPKIKKRSKKQLPNIGMQETGI